MKTVAVFSLLIGLFSCTNAQVDLFPPDAGSEDLGPTPDAGPEDVGAPDAGSVDLGQPDSGPTPDLGMPMLVCPTELTAKTVRFHQSVRSEPGVGVEVAANPDWTFYVAASSFPGQVTQGQTFWPEGISIFGAGTSPAGPIAQGPHAAAWGTDEFSWVASVDQPGATILNGASHGDGWFDYPPPLEVQGAWRLTDLISTGRYLVYALTSSTGEAVLSARTLSTLPTGFRDVTVSTAQARVEDIRLSATNDSLWMATKGFASAPQFEGPTFTFGPLVNGQRTQFINFLSCATPTGYDVAAVDPNHGLLVRDCQGSTNVLMNSTRQSKPGWSSIFGGGVSVPTQVAHDGRTTGLLRWRAGEPRPMLTFYDDEGVAVSEALPIDIDELQDAPVQMDIAGAVDSNGERSFWIVGIITRNDDGTFDLVVSEFEGCSLRAL